MILYPSTILRAMGFVLAKLMLPVRRVLNLCNSSKKEDPRKQILERLALLEAGERDDYQTALALERGESLPPPTVAQLEMTKASFAELLGKFLVADLAAERSPPYEGASTESKRSVTGNLLSKMREPVSVECVVCRGAFESMACLQGTCDHFICRHCVIAMAEVASRNEDLFPLQCCQKQLPTDTFLGFLNGPLRATFSSKCAEAATPANLRVYCPNKTCSVFIGRSYTSTPCVMSCPECSMEVCSQCKSKAHPRESCDDNESRDVRALAKEKGWKTCPNCKMIVERSYGCPHMLCRCRKEFCYNCGSRWGRCRCR